MSEEKLLPCPWCGDSRIRIGVYPLCDNFWGHVICLSCKSQCPSTIKSTREELIESLVDRWNTQPRQLHWTKEKPTKDHHWQWFWYQEKSGYDPYLVYIQNACVDGKTVVCSTSRPNSDLFLPVDKMDGYWAGPIAEPKWE